MTRWSRYFLGDARRLRPPPRPDGKRLGLVGLVFFVVAAGAAEHMCEINVNVSVTKAGEKFARPTREHPAYYYPLLAAWREDEAAVAGEGPPLRAVLVKPLARALAAQGYLVVGPNTPSPTLLLVIHWGALSPEIDESEDAEGEPQKQFLNQTQMLALVGGNTFGELDLNFERDAVMQAAEEDRYFVIVSAFDYADALKKKRTLLWRARMSTPSLGVTMPEVVRALVESGASHFGRATLRPVWTEAPVREGRVVLDEMIVVPDEADPSKHEDKTGRK